MRYELISIDQQNFATFFSVVSLFVEIWAVKFFPYGIRTEFDESHHVWITRHFSTNWHGNGATSLLIQINQMPLFSCFPKRGPNHLYGVNHRLEYIITYVCSKICRASCVTCCVFSVIKVHTMQGWLSKHACCHYCITSNLVRLLI